MAVIKIKTISNNLQAVINYAQNGDKTDDGILVSGVNCVPKKAYSEMMLTKKFFHKEKGRQGYHIIQSFKGNEVSADEANEIGVRLAEELFGDKFQAIVCTHVNKHNIHNHIVLNSVSYLDGSKYHNSNAEIALLKDKSDELCWRYDLSIVKTTEAKEMNKVYQNRITNYNRCNSKMQKVKLDIDEAIRNTKKYNDFRIYLKSKGYVINDKGTYFTVKSPYFSRNIRLDRAFGKEYSFERIKERIYYRCEVDEKKGNVNKKYFRKIYKGPKIDKHRLKRSSFYRSYVCWLYKMGVLPAKVEYQELTPEYFKQRQEVKNIFEENHFIARNNIHSMKDAVEYEKTWTTVLSIFKSQRENMWRQYHKITASKEKSEMQFNISLKTHDIDTIAQNLKVCRRFIRRYQTLQNEAINRRRQEYIRNEIIDTKANNKAR